MRSKDAAAGDGFVEDLLPLLRSGFEILRSILDVLIERIEEAEHSRDLDVRKDIYSSIIDALEAEIENIQKKGAETPAARAKTEVLEAVISALMKETEELDAQKAKKGRRPQKVKID